MNNFDECLSFEKSQQARADKFYNSLGATKIERCDWNDPVGKTNQKKDIDVIVDFPTKKSVKISEKFREKDWGDVMVEMWDNAEAQKEGCIVKSEADELYYYTPNRCVVIDAQQLKKFTRYVMEEYSLKSIMHLLKDNPKGDFQLAYNGESFTVTIRTIKSYRKPSKGFYSNTSNKNFEWTGVTYSIKMENLAAIVDTKIYNLK